MRTSIIARLLSLTLFLSTAAALGAGSADRTGIVTGVVKHRSVKKSPTVVYVEDIQVLKPEIDATVSMSISGLRT